MITRHITTFLFIIITISLSSCRIYTPKELVPVEFKVDIELTQTNISSGNTIYQARCAPCHGVDGRGDGPSAAAMNPKPRNHQDKEYMNNLTNEHLFSLLKAGGAAKGMPLMPSFGTLSDDELKHTIAFLRSLTL